MRKLALPETDPIVEFTIAGANQRIAINVTAIQFVQESQTSPYVCHLLVGGTIRDVAGSYDEIMTKIRATDPK